MIHTKYILLLYFLSFSVFHFLTLFKRQTFFVVSSSARMYKLQYNMMQQAKKSFNHLLHFAYSSPDRRTYVHVVMKCTTNIFSGQNFTIHAIYHQKFMSALVRFLATKPRRVYLFPVVIEYKKILTKKRAPITLYFLHQWSFYISYHIFRKFSNTKRKEYLRYYYYHFLQGVPFHEKKSFLFLLMRLRMEKISMEDL